MKAIVQEKYGSPCDVLNLKVIDKPVVKDDEVLVRVHAASVHPDVWHVVRGMPYVLRLMGAGLLRPKNSVPGTDVAGHVESVGKNVSQFQQDDEVFGETIKGYQWTNGGAYAEYVSVPEDSLALKPANLAFEQAAAVPTSGLIALHNLPNEGRLHPGHATSRPIRTSETPQLVAATTRRGSPGWELIRYQDVVSPGAYEEKTRARLGGLEPPRSHEGSLALWDWPAVTRVKTLG
jgi:NADPH:quinone reductase-like Zn-dependent oxidoreductase